MQDLSVKLACHKPPLPGMVEDVRTNAEGAIAVVRFSNTTDPGVRVAELVDLEFAGGYLSSPIQVSARVLARARDETRYLCEFQLEKETATALLSPANRRQALRVKPSGASPVRATLHTVDGKKLIDVVINDISNGGLSVFVTQEEEATLFSFWVFKLSLWLPQREGPIDFACTVRNRRLLGSMITYGVQFDPGATEGFADKQERVQTYIMQRQREELRARRKDSAA